MVLAAQSHIYYLVTFYAILSTSPLSRLPNEKFRASRFLRPAKAASAKMTLIAGRVCAAVWGKNATGVNPTPAGTNAAAMAWTGDWEADENNDPPPTENVK